jgi:cell division protein FtsQ
MPSGKRFFNALLLVFWIALSVGVLTLLVAAIETRNAKPCSDLKIVITGPKDALFVDQKDVKKMLMAINGDHIIGRPLKDFDLRRMEDSLESDPWISNAELFFDNNRVLQVKVKEKEPVARVFTVTGNSFYIDTSLFRLPLNNKFTPRLPVFTGFPSDRKKWKGKDSLLISQVRDISLFLKDDPFWMAQIDQVDIDAERNFQMVPKVGKHMVQFGDGKEVEQKFRKLFIFYRDVISKTGWSRYAAVNVGYKGQVVATRKDMQAVKADTVLARQWMVQMIKNLKEQALKDTFNTKRVTTTRIKEQL